MIFYYAVYRSSNTKQGCRKQFLTTRHPDTKEFLASVSYPCEDCHTTHAFMFSKTIMASTPKQQGHVSEWCSRQGIEMGVELTTLSS